MTVELWWSSLAAADRGLFRLLDGVERARVASLDRPADRGRSLLAAALLRVAVGAHLAVEPAQVLVDRTCPECGKPHGAPRILGPGGPAPWVSVSHSGLLVLVALSPHGPVGVDVQRAAELADPGGAPAWVRREAAFKAVSVARDRGHPAGRIAPGAAEAATSELRPPLGGYAAAVTTLGERGPRLTHRHWGPAGDHWGPAGRAVADQAQ